MYKCPYCGFDSNEQQCERCKAMIPTVEEKTEESDEEEPTTRKRHKEMKENGT